MYSCPQTSLSIGSRATTSWRFRKSGMNALDKDSTIRVSVTENNVEVSHYSNRRDAWARCFRSPGQRGWQASQQGTPLPLSRSGPGFAPFHAGAALIRIRQDEAHISTREDGAQIPIREDPIDVARRRVTKSKVPRHLVVQTKDVSIGTGICFDGGSAMCRSVSSNGAQYIASSGRGRRRCRQSDVGEVLGARLGVIHVRNKPRIFGLQLKLFGGSVELGLLGRSLELSLV